LICSRASTNFEDVESLSKLFQFDGDSNYSLTNSIVLRGQKPFFEDMLSSPLQKPSNILSEQSLFTTIYLDSKGSSIDAFVKLKKFET
jgi:hypothetical protein